MCGIAGLIGEWDAEAGRDSVRSMMRCLETRGPDGEGIASWDGAVLGHRRLSIFDLSSLGSQPMLSADGAIGVVFNGAIYNFLELREELERAGFVFRSRSDTEVLVHGYEHWGVQNMLPKLRGMFAIAIWDSRNRRAYLFRDRLGVKPLLYSIKNGRLAFASTAPALRAAQFDDELDDRSIVEFLEFGYVTDARTVFRGMQKLSAGHVLEWTDGKVETRSYWKFPSVPSATGVSFNEAVEHTEALFLDAVRLRLEADVKVGALLSGGVDSSLVCWAITKLGGHVDAFTIGTPNDAMDETSDAVATARMLGIPHHVIPVAADDVPDVNELISAYGEPFACASALGMLRVSKAVKNEATVLLTGDGGDDIFLGYPEHRNFWRAQRLANKLPDASLPFWKSMSGLVPRVGVMARAAHFVDYATGGIGAVANAHDGLPVYWQNGLLGERLSGLSVSQRSIAWSHDSARHLLSEFLEYDRTTRFTGEYLTKVDGGTMRYAIEARSPFLDHLLWEYAGSLPFDVRLHGGQSKAVLREIARRRIGERVASGAKRGFGIPVGRWLAGNWGTNFRTMMEDSQLEKEGYINSKNVISFWKQCAATGTVPNQLWYVYVLEHWLRMHRATAPMHSESLFSSTTG
ncbi:MAG: asparagine synthase (glutamine-hydrolyzing) [Gemmatimonadaceae bacterium]